MEDPKEESPIKNFNPDTFEVPSSDLEEMQRELERQTIEKASSEKQQLEEIIERKVSENLEGKKVKKQEKGRLH